MTDISEARVKAVVPIRAEGMVIGLVLITEDGKEYQVAPRLDETGEFMYLDIKIER